MNDRAVGAPRILFLGSAPTLGDGAIGAALLARLRTAWPAADLHLLTGSPEFYASLPEAAGAEIGPKPRLTPPAASGPLAGLVNVGRFARRARTLAGRRHDRLPDDVRREIERTYDRADLVVHQGGPQWNDRWLGRGAVRFHMLRLLAASAGPDEVGGRRPVALLGQGFGPFDFGAGPRGLVRRRLAAAALDRCRVLVTRDRASRPALERLGVRRPDVFETTDVAVTLEPRTGRESDALVERLRGLDGPVVAVSLRSLRAEYGGLQEREEAFVSTFARFLDRIAERATPVFLSTGGADDARTLEAVLARRHGTEPVLRLDPPTDPSELARVYGACAVLVTVRLHPMILAATAGTPSLSISYDPKCDDFARRAGLDRFQLPFAEFDADRATALLDELLGDRAAVARRLAARVDGLAREVRETLDRALALCAADLPA